MPTSYDQSPPTPSAHPDAELTARVVALLELVETPLCTVELCWLLGVEEELVPVLNLLRRDGYIHTDVDQRNSLNVRRPTMWRVRRAEWDEITAHVREALLRTIVLQTALDEALTSRAADLKRWAYIADVDDVDAVAELAEIERCLLEARAVA